MSNNKGFIGVNREIINHWIYQDPEYFKVWFEMIYRARYSFEPETTLMENQLITINRGEFIFGRKSWSERLKVGEQRLRTLIRKLTQDNMIELVNKYNKFTIYKIINYEKYNQQSNQQATLENRAIEGYSNQQGNQQPTNSQPTANQQPTTQEQSSNKENKVNKEYKDIVEYLNSKTNKNYRSTSKATQRLIDARVNEGFTLGDFKRVIDNKVNTWLDNEKMNEYLRPQTLFGTKFESYLNEGGSNNGNGRGQHKQNGNEYEGIGFSHEDLQDL